MSLFPLDPALRRDRGVYATPRPLVAFVVRSVDRLLRSKLGKADGLSDPTVRLLDPAAGPMNFLRAAWWEAILDCRRRGGDVPELVRTHLLPHSRGIELLPRSHARGELAMRRLLAATGCRDSYEPSCLLLANALSPPAELLAEPATVVLGNPPWRGRSSNLSPWIADLLRGYQLPDGSEDEGYFQVDGRPLGERTAKWLHDDGVKFLRLAQWKVDREGQGIVAFVVNHNGLDAPTFRGLRRSLLRTFDEIYALDLHGNGRKRERTPDDRRDESVFRGVAQGAAVLLLVKKPGLEPRVLRGDLYGKRREKLRALARTDVETTPWTEVRPEGPGYFFVAGGDRQVEREYERGLSLPEIFPIHSVGMLTGRDALATGLDHESFERRLAGLRGLPQKPASPGSMTRCLEDLRQDPHWRRKLTPFLARPFDVRFVLYADYLLERPRTAVLQHLTIGGNLGLIVPRQCKEEPGALVTRIIPGHKAVSAYDINSVFPLYLQEGGARTPNLGPKVRHHLASRYGQEPHPETVLAYVYAVLYSLPYRRRYRELLQRSFPRIPFPREERGFLELARLGAELIGLHLLRDPRLKDTSVRLAGDGSQRLTEDRRLLRSYCPAERRIRLNEQGLRFEGIEPQVWSYRIGGYPVLGKWLQARGGRMLRWEESREFRRIAEALRRTIVIQSEIAQVYATIQL